MYIYAECMSGLELESCVCEVSVITLKALNYFCVNNGDQSGFFQFEIIITVFSFEYLCHGSPAIINIFTLTSRGSTLVVKI